ncbi:MAG: hypothetical protein H6524_04015 [Actinobacteria bacterium]|nr:hypothetical protein [Actinomycetota bacterium]MCB9427956.1 hypothetical protein [Actinomycetota bacterium]HPE11224.1 hypothetical protein [Actinomycetota bacterium]HRV64717.1 hypothetical protein [Candidatus Nanopelagicales bacterium]
MRKLLAAATSAVLAGSAMVVVTPPVAAKTTYKACVKKSTGDVRVLLGKKKKKKCKKGWKKVSWTKAGPTGKSGSPGSPGATGPRTSMGTVIDGNGAVVGESLSTLPVSITAFIVRIDGGIFFYYPNGTLLPTDTVYFKDAACAGTAYARASSPNERDLLLASPSYRTVYRVGSPTLGPATAYRFDSTSESVTNVQFYSRGSDGVCAASGGVYTGYTVPLVPVTAPPDHPGPLKVV